MKLFTLTPAQQSYDTLNVALKRDVLVGEGMLSRGAEVLRCHVEHC